MSVKIHVPTVKACTSSVPILNHSQLLKEQLPKGIGDLAMAVELPDADAREVLRITPHVRDVVRTRSDAPIKTAQINMSNQSQVSKVV